MYKYIYTQVFTFQQVKKDRFYEPNAFNILAKLLIMQQMGRDMVTENREK